MKKYALAALFAVFILSCSQKEVRRTMNVQEGQTPAVVAALVAAVTNASTPAAQDAALAAWRKSHPEALLPLASGSQVTFVYYESPTNGKTISNVSLVSVWNGYEKDKLFLHRAGNTGLYTLTIRAPVTNEPYYYYDVWYAGEEASTKKLDPFNACMIYAGTYRNIVHSVDDPHGFLQIIRQVRPVTTIAPIQKRDITVFLPPGYYTETNRRYPVLYMHDGQNLWDLPSANYGGWKMDTALVKLMNEGKIPPVIIVGIANTGDRPFEYVGFSLFYQYPVPAGDEALVSSQIKKAFAYEDFLVHQVKPMIDGLYRTLPDRANTSIAGSSFGGGGSLFIAFRNPDVFGKVASLSGGNWPTSDSMFIQRPFNVFPYLIDKVIKKNTGLKIYIDCGDQDLDKTFLLATQSMHEALKKLGYKDGEDMAYYENLGRGHNETSWALVAPRFLEFFYGE